jgi:hypothetical protein
MGIDPAFAVALDFINQPWQDGDNVIPIRSCTA